MPTVTIREPVDLWGGPVDEVTVDEAWRDYEEACDANVEVDGISFSVDLTEDEFHEAYLEEGVGEDPGPDIGTAWDAYQAILETSVRLSDYHYYERGLDEESFREEYQQNNGGDWEVNGGWSTRGTYHWPSDDYSLLIDTVLGYAEGETNWDYDSFWELTENGQPVAMMEFEEI
jgi:hypothetical protein